MHKNNTHGFTLIEVLIAAIILFSSIAVVAQLFSASSLSSKKAANVSQYNQTIPLIVRMIKVDVQQRAKDRELTMLNGTVLAFGYEYVWQADRLSLLPAAPEDDDDDFGTANFGLYSVNVSIERNQKLGDFTFEVATW